MSKYNFKIGDKTKVYDTTGWNQGYRVGEVTGIDYLYVRVSWGEDGDSMLYLPSEIYKVKVKGQQLLFSFMEGD